MIMYYIELFKSHKVKRRGVYMHEGFWPHCGGWIGGDRDGDFELDNTGDIITGNKYANYKTMEYIMSRNFRLSRRKMYRAKRKIDRALEEKDIHKEVLVLKDNYVIFMVGINYENNPKEEIEECWM